ncbi:hypothetical protein HZH66_013996 [Vespula vulgaris]|uniref:Uncharacterized protein n=1 Tax=Vespula vulgaris TaxID=7454 RepID=A0A834MQI4_VESVU|nr:hypothetical protein HZH66_013996 [Vespula vulgaris]
MLDGGSDLHIVQFSFYIQLEAPFLNCPLWRNTYLGRKYTTFVDLNRHNEFLKVPFGLCNLPAVFQRHMQTIFRSLIKSTMELLYLRRFDNLFKKRTGTDAKIKLYYP